MRIPHEHFAGKVHAEWDNRETVSALAYEEIVSHGDRIDFEDHRHSMLLIAIQIGIIAGQSVSSDDFIDRFTKFLNED